MKKFYLIVFTFICIIISYSEEYVLFGGEAYNFNEYIESMSRVNYHMKYDDEYKVYYLFLSDYSNSVWIELHDKEMNLLRNNINKYYEWEKLAVEKQVKLEKELPNSSFITNVTWETLDKWYSSNFLNLNFIFFSQNINRHQLVIYTNKVESTENEYIDWKMEDLYFDKNDVDYLYENIKVESINNFIKKHEEQKNTESLFN